MRCWVARWGLSVSSAEHRSNRAKNRPESTARRKRRENRWHKLGGRLHKLWHHVATDCGQVLFDLGRWLDTSLHVFDSSVLAVPVEKVAHNCVARQIRHDGHDRYLGERPHEHSRRTLARITKEADIVAFQCRLHLRVFELVGNRNDPTIHPPGAHEFEDDVDESGYDANHSLDKLDAMLCHDLDCHLFIERLVDVQARAFWRHVKLVTLTLITLELKP